MSLCMLFLLIMVTRANDNLTRHYFEQLVAFLDVEKNKQLSDYRGYVAEKEKRELEAKVENERHKVQEATAKLKEAEEEKEELKEKRKRLEEKVEEEKQRALAAAAEKQEAEAKLQKTEAMKEELEEEKKKIEASAEQEKAKAAEAAARERKIADKLHFKELEANAAKNELEEKTNKASKLEQKITSLTEKEEARFQESERELIILREQCEHIVHLRQVRQCEAVLSICKPKFYLFTGGATEKRKVGLSVRDVITVREHWPGSRRAWLDWDIKVDLYNSALTSNLLLVIAIF
ncbi:hypothetical protein EB796_007249 [Bugula neritina]|uniref:Uncharacterized protein n=1 Tax=Bugula neritina TaxID=10212 RepID=A0A7J7K925_BUGNE|nr:hypothetical protein EB796_007249 [Bugula neritina]